MNDPGNRGPRDQPSGFGDSEGASAIHPIDGFLAEWAPIPEKRIDFLTALRDDPLPDLERLYWLARITLVTRLEDVPRVRRAVRDLVQGRAGDARAARGG